MKIFYSLILFLIFRTFSISAQNQIPEVSILSTEISVDVVNIEYEITDPDNDNFDVSIWISEDGGNKYMELSGVSGDAGQVSQTGVKFVFVDKTALTGEYQLRIVVDDMEPIDIDAIVASVDTDNVKSYLEEVEGIRHYIADLGHLNYTRSYVLDHLSTMNLDTSIQYFPFNGSFTGQNLLARDEGVQCVKGEYLVGGHYDTVDDSPGADDNGTAVAALMEIARVFQDYNFDHSVRYVSWDQEEAGLVGSAFYVNNLASDAEVEGYLNFEMLGYYSEKPNSQSLPAGFELLFPDITQEVADDDFRGNFLTNVGNTANSNTLMMQFDSIAGEYVPELRVISIPSPGNGIAVPDLLRSDHAPFWINEMPAIMLTDASEFRNPNYHTEFDVTDSLDMDFLANNVKAAVAYLAVKAGVNHKGFTTIGSAEVNTSINNTAWENTFEVFPNPALDLLYIRFQYGLTASANLEILDMTGKIVQHEVVSAGTNEYTLAVDGLASGQYILKVGNAEHFVTKGFVKGGE